MNRTARLVSSVFAVAFVLLLLGAPAVADHAGVTYQQRGDIVINSDAEFDSKRGVRSGSGTFTDPYVISGWSLSNLTIRNTNKYVDIHHNQINGRLLLDWIGDRPFVFSNTVGDLRVNQNVQRTGEPTAGIISGNRFNSVSQIRHFDGIFQSNLVGAPAMTDAYPLNRLAVNFDGFNGAIFRNNTLYGYLEVRLHGHHHSSSFDSTSHHHGAMDSPDVDHTQRHHRVSITGNTIYAMGNFALRYIDSGHAGNDRTAASESNPALNAPHTHRTYVHLSGNRLVGAGLRVEIFNADDVNHRGTRRGTIDVFRNEVTLFPEPGETVMDRHGIEFLTVKDALLLITDNVVRGPQPDSIPNATKTLRMHSGIRLNTVENSDVLLHRNRIEDRRFGVSAARLGKSTTWQIIGLNVDDVERAVYYDTTVANAPYYDPSWPQ